MSPISWGLTLVGMLLVLHGGYSMVVRRPLWRSADTSRPSAPRIPLTAPVQLCGGWPLAFMTPIRTFAPGQLRWPLLLTTAALLIVTVYALDAWSRARSDGAEADDEPIAGAGRTRSEPTRTVG